MGKGAYIKILNETQKSYVIEFSEIASMCQGKAGSDFQPISGSIGPGGKLPTDGEWQYMEGASLLSQGRFALCVRESGTGQQVARLKFSVNFASYDVASEESGSVSDLGGLLIDYAVTNKATSQDEIVVYLKDKYRIKDAPFWRVVLDNHDQVVTDVDALMRGIKAEQITDLLVLVHGMNNTPIAACSIYEHYVETVWAAKGQAFAPDRIGLLGLIWPADCETVGYISGKLERIFLRAMQIGQNRLAPLLTQLSGELPSLRIHLFGHSMGARLAAWTLKGLPSEWPVSPIKSVFLAQGAIEAKMFESGNDLAGHEAKVDGPLVATYSASDGLLQGLGYFKGAFPLGVRGFQGVKAHTVRASAALTRHDLEGHRFINLDCNGVIEDHNDYKKVEVALAHLLAARLK